VVQAIQKEIVISTVARNDSSVTAAPKLGALFASTPLNVDDALLFPGSLNATVSIQLLQFLAKMLPYAPPESLSTSSSIEGYFEMAGIHNSTYIAPLGVNFTAVGQLVNASLSTELAMPDIYENYGNGWEAFTPAVSRNFGTNYQVRAYIAWSGYLQLDTYIAIYPEYGLSAGRSNMLNVTANSSLIYTFSAKPPVNGFWSLTVYGANNFLVPNSLNVYALGDRSNITYPDGIKVYGNTTATPTTDSTFQILMQPADVAPPANWTSNWIPAPSGGGQISVNLRYYGPTDMISNGDYVEPVVTTQGSIVG